MVLLYMLTLSMVSLPTILARNHFVGNPKGGDYQLPPPLPPRDYEHTNHPGPFYINKEGRPVYSEKLVHPGPGFSKKLEHPGSDYSKKSQMPPPPMRVENVKCSKGVKRTSKEKGVIKVYCKNGNTKTAKCPPGGQTISRNDGNTVTIRCLDLRGYPDYKPGQDYNADKCGQKPIGKGKEGGGFCKMLLIAWAMEQGECKKFEVGGCYLEGGFDSEEECQRACKGQDYILWG